MKKKKAKSPVIDVSIVCYPESDGRPMAESDWHRDEMARQIELLKQYYDGQEVYVSGALLLYYEQGNPKKFVVPDVFVVKGVNADARRFFKTWVERRVPDVVIETTSLKTKRKDTIDKPALYARLGILECFFFDPTAEYRDPPLQGYRLVGERYAPIQADERGALVSDVLAMRLQFDKGQLAFYRLDNGDRLLTSRERIAAESHARRETVASQCETELRQAAEAEVGRLRAELQRRTEGA